jgi:hypothetical protein
MFQAFHPPTLPLINLLKESFSNDEIKIVADDQRVKE